MSGLGFTVAACNECGCERDSYHYPGCSLAPYVCPGCYAIGDEQCAGYCPDAAIARSREEESERASYEDRDDEDDQAEDFAAVDLVQDERCTQDGGRFTP